MTFWDWINKGNRPLWWMPGVIIAPYMVLMSMLMFGSPSCPSQTEKKLKADKQWAKQHILERIESECKEFCHGQEHRAIVSKASVYVDCVCADGTSKMLNAGMLSNYED